MSQFVVRVGDQDDYHIEDEISDVAERLRMCRVEGPLTPYICTSSWASPSMRGKVVGVESTDCRRNNFISLYVSDNGTMEYGGSLTEEQIAELNALIPQAEEE